MSYLQLANQVTNTLLGAATAAKTLPAITKLANDNTVRMDNANNKAIAAQATKQAQKQQMKLFRESFWKEMYPAAANKEVK